LKRRFNIIIEPVRGLTVTRMSAAGLEQTHLAGFVVHQKKPSAGMKYPLYKSF
jgi:hypothetical protein